MAEVCNPWHHVCRPQMYGVSPWVTRIVKNDSWKKKKVSIYINNISIFQVPPHYQPLNSLLINSALNLLEVVLGGTWWYHRSLKVHLLKYRTVLLMSKFTSAPMTIQSSKTHPKLLNLLQWCKLTQKYRLLSFVNTNRNLLKEVVGVSTRNHSGDIGWQRPTVAPHDIQGLYCTQIDHLK